MNTLSILELYHSTKDISDDSMASIQNDGKLRKEMVSYFSHHIDREFAIELLHKFIAIRKQASMDMPFEDLMFACYILGLQKNIEDCIKIWDAKYVDFDTYCGVDVQLVAFSGRQETLNFLAELGLMKIYDHLIYCSMDGDFDPPLKDYFDLENLPWYI